MTDIGNITDYIIDTSLAVESFRPPVVLCIAGSDPSGGAGLQGDIKTSTTLGVFAAGAVTALTVQNTLGVKDIFPVDSDMLRAQIECVLEDMSPDAVKVGMLPSASSVEVVAELISQYGLSNVVADPVLRTSSGFDAGKDMLSLSGAYASSLFPVCDVVTPNVPEAEFFLRKENREIPAQPEEMVASLLRRWGCRSVLLKGGHDSGNECVDLLATNEGDKVLVKGCGAVRIESKNTHGTGCALSTAIACALAKGMDLQDAVVDAKWFISCAIAGSAEGSLGKGNGPLDLLNFSHNPHSPE